MAISFVGSSLWEASANNGGDATITISSVGADDYIVVTVGIGSSSPPTITVTSSSTADAYTPLMAQLDSSNMHMGVFGKLLTGANTQVRGFGTGNGTDSLAIVAMAFRGIEPSNPIDVTTTSTTGSGTTPDSPSITVVSCACAIISAVNAQVSDISVTAPSSFLNNININSNDNFDATCGMAWITNASTSAFNPASWTSFTSATWGSATIALRPFGATPPFIYQDYFPQYPDFYRVTEIVGY